MASEAKIVIGAKDETKGAFTSVKQSLGGLQTSAASVQAAFAALAGAALVASYAQKTRDAINYADGLGKLSQKAGVSVEALSALTYAGKLADVSQEILATGIKFLNKEIASGGETLQKLGIATKDASGNMRGAEQVFSDVANVIASLDDENPQKAAVAYKLLGKRGNELIPLMNGGAAALKEAADEAKRFGLIIDQEAAKKAEELNDNITRLSENMRGGFIQGIQPAIKYLAELSTFFTKVEKDVGGVSAAMITFGKIISEISGLNPADAAARQASLVAGDKARIQGLIEQYRNVSSSGPGAADAERNIAKLQGKLDALDKSAVRATQSLANALGVDKPSAGGGRGFVNPPIVKGKGLQLDPNIFKEAKSEGAGAAAKESAYASLNKRVQEQIALMQMEMAKGRELTAVEQFRTKLMEDAALSREPLSAKELKSLEDQIAKYVQLNEQITLRRRNEQVANEYAVEYAKLFEDEQKAIEEFAKKKSSDAARASQDASRMLQDLQFENSLIGLNNQDRALAIKLRELESLGMKKNSEEFEAYAAEIKKQLDVKEAGEKASKQFDDILEIGTDLLQGKTDSIKRYFEEILRESLKLKALKPLLEDIFGITSKTGFGGFGGGSSGGGLGGIFSGLIKPAGFGISDVGGAGAAGSSVFSSIFGGFFANGGRPPVGKASMVGERGPELFVPSSAGTIVPNGKFGGMTFAPNTTINIGGGGDTGALRAEFAQALQARDRRWARDLQDAGVVG